VERVANFNVPQIPNFALGPLSPGTLPLLWSSGTTALGLQGGVLGLSVTTTEGLSQN